MADKKEKNMGLWAQSPAQILSSEALANSFTAVAAALTAALGTGVIGAGLTLTATTGASASLSAGMALAGVVMQLVSDATLSFPGGTWDVWACDTVFSVSGGSPVAGTYPNALGIDVLVPTVVASGSTPAAPGCLLATVVSTGSALTSINNTPSGRNSIPGPSPAGTVVAWASAGNIAQPTGGGGTVTAFALTYAPNPSTSLAIWQNGLLIESSQYTLSGSTVTFGTPPLETDILAAQFVH